MNELQELLYTENPPDRLWERIRSKLPVFYTYLWLREDGTPYYVGKGSYKRAYVRHRKGSRLYPPKNRHNILIQEHPLEKDAFAAEVFFIAYYGRKSLGTGCLLNLTDGGEKPPSQRGVYHSKESRLRTAESNRGRKRSKETKDKMSAAQKGNKKGRGHKVSLEHIARLKAVHIGRVPSKETRLKMSIAKKGKSPWNKGKSGYICTRKNKNV